MQARHFLLPLIDTCLVSMSWLAAFWLRFNLEIPEAYLSMALHSGPWVVMATVGGLVGAQVYRQVWQYTGLPEARQLAFGVFIGAGAAAVGVLMFRVPDFPRSVLLLHPLLALFLLSVVRAAWRTFRESTSVMPGSKPLLIAGSIAYASEPIRAIKRGAKWHPIAIVSPNKNEQGMLVQGVPVVGTTASIDRVAEAFHATAALIVSPIGTAERRDLLLEIGHFSHLTWLTMPRPDEWLRAEAGSVRKVELDDLLRRAPVVLDENGLSRLLAGQTVLVTGAGGSIGSELCRQIARFGVVKLVCLDVSEYAAYQLEQELRAAHPQMQGLYYTANVREFNRMLAIARAHRPAVVFHAAAYKHVPLMEDLNEVEALRTNVEGTLNAARVAGEVQARRFVLVSTDKAVNPTNVMGASKRLAELAMQAVARQFDETQYVAVRFGNVLGSSGSVVPLFTQQIARGGPVTVTHPDIVRYFMTIPEAAQLVLQAGLMGQSGQIFVLDMGEPVKIVDLARMMIRLSGKTEGEVPICFTGLRPGEKLFEELLADDETTEPTPHPKLRVAKVSGGQSIDVDAVCRWIEEAGPAPDGAAVRQWLRTQVPEYQPR